MKKITFLLSLLLLFSCVPDDEFDEPGPEAIPAVAAKVNADLKAVLGRYYQGKMETTYFEEDLVIEAYVISSDEAGNWYKELVVQDRPENPLAGVAIKINMTSYFQFYNFGRKVYINLNGLSIGNVNGIPTLGIASGKQVENIPQSRVSRHITRSSGVYDIVAKPIGSHQFDENLKNLYVKVENVQFSKILVDPENPFTYASEANDEFDGERILESCSGNFPFILSTSTYADFAAFKLPKNSGSVKGVLTRDYYDGFYTIYLNSPVDIDFSENKRCDPLTRGCGISVSTGTKILFQEDFTSEKNNKPVLGNGWSNYIQEGSRPWEAYTATGGNASLGRSARMRPGGSGDSRSISWLITPRINFDTNSGEVLNFKTSTSFANGSFLDVLISTDWDGQDENILSASWATLASAYVAQDTDFFGDWLSSGNVDLSCFEGKGHIAFRYTGSDLAYYNGIYELDDILISAD